MSLKSTRIYGIMGTNFFRQNGTSLSDDRSRYPPPPPPDELLYNNRDNMRGGGVGFYIKATIKFKRREEIENRMPDLEHLWVNYLGKIRIVGS